MYDLNVGDRVRWKEEYAKCWGLYGEGTVSEVETMDGVPYLRVKWDNPRYDFHYKWTNSHKFWDIVPPASPFQESVREYIRANLPT